MFRTIAATIPRDRDFSERVWRLDVLRRALDGTLYDELPYDFHQEKNEGSGEYIPLRRRAPSVRYGLCRVVVEDSIALLFGEGRFPALYVEDEATREGLLEIVRSTKLNRVMVSAAVRGSIGSVVVWLRVLNGRPYFEVLDTVYLTPEWQPDAPDQLLRVTERYKVKGETLREAGYDVPDDRLQVWHWFQRQWDTDAETWFVPTPVALVTRNTPLAIDLARTTRHALGVVPMVWIRNLAGASSTGSPHDGGCTFRPALDAAIEIDYQLSQAGRGLKYSSDPLLMIREPAAPDDTMIRGAGNALVVSAEGDAKLLEIGGSAAAAVIEYVRTLRELALESVHGNRSNADKLSAAQSGRALELLHQPLIWLADNLRVSYGEEALVALANMLVAVSQKIPLTIGNRTGVKLSNAEPVTLRWNPWFPPTQDDKSLQANTLVALTGGGLMSREAAITQVAEVYDIEDVAAEQAKIDADIQAASDRTATEQASIANATERAKAVP